MKERIKKIRKELDLTQQEFSEKIGIKRNTIANYETGRNEPVDSVISLICREFNVNEVWLRTGEGEMFNPEHTDSLDQLIAEYELSDIASAMVECFINLKPNIQNEMFNFFSKVVSLVNGEPKSVSEKENELDETTKYALELFRKNYPKTPEELEGNFELGESSDDSQTG